MSKKSGKKMSTYKKSLLIFFLILLVLCEFALIYVNSSLKKYEMGDVDTYMKNLVAEIKDAGSKGNIKKFFDLPKVESKYEKSSSLEKGYQDLLSKAKMSYKKTDEKNVYDIYADDLLLANVKLDDSKTVHRLGLLTFTDYKIKDIEAFNKDGLYTLDFYLPSDYTLKINGITVGDDVLKDEEMIKGFEDAYDKVTLPKLNHYEIKGLASKPRIMVLDSSGIKVKHKEENGKYYANNYYQTDNEKEAMAKLNHEFDSLEFAKNWSKFLTADLEGSSHGFSTLSPNLMEGSAMYNRALQWATGVDVTFTSIHTLDSITNTKVSNFTVYNKDAFSVEVYLEKNMTLKDGQKKTDVLHDIFYYVYYDGAYRLMYMQTVKD